MTYAIITRAEWEALPPRRAFAWLGPRCGLTLHWEGSANGLGDYSPDDAFQIVRDIQIAHQHHPTEDYSDIAYSFLISRHGQIFEGRGWDMRPGSNGTSEANQASLGVCYLGGPPDELTAAAIGAYAWLYDQHRARGGRSAVYTHSHWVATACPGPDLSQLAEALAAGTLAPAAQLPPPEPPPAKDDDDMAKAHQAQTPDGTVWLVNPPFKMALRNDSLRIAYMELGYLAAGDPVQVHPWTLDDLAEIRQGTIVRLEQAAEHELAEEPKA